MEQPFPPEIDQTGAAEDPLLAELPPVDHPEKKASLWQKLQARLPSIHPGAVGWVMYGILGSWFIFILILNGGFGSKQYTGAAGYLIFGGLIGVLGLCAVFPYLAPVRCSRAGCAGWMHPTWVRQPGSGYGLAFECRNCGEVYYTNFKLGRSRRY